MSKDSKKVLRKRLKIGDKKRSVQEVQYPIDMHSIKKERRDEEKYSRNFQNYKIWIALSSQDNEFKKIYTQHAHKNSDTKNISNIPETSKEKKKKKGKSQ